MGFSFIAATGNLNDASGTTLDCSASLNVAAGDLLVCWISNEGSATGYTVAKNSGSPANTFTFDAADLLANNVFGQMGYLLAAAADATATFRCTWAAARTFRIMIVAQFRPDSGATVAKHVRNGGTGLSSTASSGNITTTAPDTVVIGYSNLFASGATSNEQIGGVAKDGVSRQDQASLWYRILASTIAGASATATQASSDSWICGIVAFSQIIQKPTYKATGTLASGIGDVTVSWPTHAIGDVGLLYIETADETAVLSTPAGFQQLPTSPQSGTAPLIANRTRLTVYWCRADSASMTSPVIADPGDHAIAYIMTFSGVRSSDPPWNTTAGDAQITTASTVIAVPGGTVTQPDCLIVSAASYKQAGPDVSGWTNPDLANVTQRADLGAADGNAGAIAVATGEMLTAGVFQATTATLGTGSQQGRIMVALAPFTAALPPTLPAEIFNYEGEA